MKEAKKFGMFKEPSLEPMNEVPSKRQILLKRLSVAFIFISLAMVLVVSTKYYVDPAEGFADELWKMTGHSLIIAGISYLIWRFFQKKEGIGLLYFSIILLLVSSYRCVRMMEEVYGAKHVAKDLATMAKDVMEGKDFELRTVDTKKYGESKFMMQTLNSFAVQIQKDFDAMGKEMGGQDVLSLVASLLTPETLTNPRLIEEGKARLTVFHDILEKYEVLFEQRLQDLGERIGRSNKTGTRGIVGIGDVFTISKSLIDEMQSFLDFLESRQGEYKLVDEKMVFVSQEDANTYNNHMKELFRIEAEMISLRTKMQDRGSELTKQLEEMMNR